MGTNPHIGGIGLNLGRGLGDNGGEGIGSISSCSERVGEISNSFKHCCLIDSVFSGVRISCSSSPLRKCIHAFRFENVIVSVTFLVYCHRITENVIGLYLLLHFCTFSLMVLLFQKIFIKPPLEGVSLVSALDYIFFGGKFILDRAFDRTTSKFTFC